MGRKRTREWNGETPPPALRHGVWYKTAKGWGAAYRRHDAKAVQVLGRRTDRRLGDCTWQQATDAITVLDAKLDALIANFDSLTPEERKALAGRSAIDVAAIVGTRKTVASYYALQIGDRPLEELAAEFNAGINHASEADAAKYDLTTVAGWAHRAYDLQAKARAHAAVADSLQPVAAKLESKPGKALAESDTLYGLLAIWRAAHPHSPDRKYVATVESLESHVGKIAWRSLTREQVRTWRDAMVAHHSAKGQRSAPTKRLDCLKGLFRAAIDAELIEADESPVRGVVIRSTESPNVDEESGAPFNGAQIKTIFEKAPAWLDPLGRSELVWLLKIMCWHGLRPYEAAQLRPTDIYTRDGIPIIHVRVTLPLGQKLQQPGKKGGLRRIPLHPQCKGFYEFARAVDGQFVFQTLTYSGKHGRAYWISRFFGRFIRDTLGFSTADNSDNALRLYSFRHSYRDAIRNASIDPEMGRVLMGHAENSSHERYGSGHALKLLAAAAAKVNPLKLGT